MDVFGWFKRKPQGDTPLQRGVALRERDCHSHVLPGVDDGSRDLAMSLQMLRLLHDAGARTVVCTSHIYPGKYDNEPATLQRAFEQLQRAVERENVALQLELGAEHFLDEHLAGRIASGAHIAFGRERYVLFEAHTGEHVPAPLFDVVRALVDRGCVPLLAHVERYHLAARARRRRAARGSARGRGSVPGQPHRRQDQRARRRSTRALPGQADRARLDRRGRQRSAPAHARGPTLRRRRVSDRGAAAQRQLARTPTVRST
ncbi:MAG: CpsB/CapC family capsule biosynthesis tyrosine phosphatase [Nannocystaceae bacterium]